MASSPSAGARRVLVWVAVALLALAAAAYATVRVLLPPERVRAMVHEQLAGVLARDVRYGDASVSLWPPIRLTVSQPGLAEVGGFERGALFEARAIHLDLDVFALLGRRVVVRRLVLDRPKLHVVMRADGTTNLDGIMKPPPRGAPPAKPMDLELKQIAIVDGRALIDDLKSGRRTALGIESRTALAAEVGGARLATSGTTRISDLRSGPLIAARLGDLGGPLASLVFTIEHDGKFDAQRKRLALGRLALDLGRASITCSGVVDDPGPHAAIDLTARGSAVDLGAVLGYLAAADAQAVHGVSGAGRLDFDLRAVGRLGGAALPALSGVLTVAGGSFRYAGAPAGVEALGFTARFAPDSLAIGDLAAKIGGQPVAATLVATRFADPWVRFSARGDVDLAAVGPMVAPRDTKLGGRVAVNVAGSGRAKDPGSLALDGGAILKGVSVRSPMLPKPVEDVHGDVRFSQTRASVTGFGARAGKSSFALDATVTRPLALFGPPAPSAGAAPAAGAAIAAPVAPGAGASTSIPPATMDFTLTSPYLDLGEIMPTTAGGAPVLPNAVGGGRVAIRRLIDQKLDVQDVAATVTLAPRVMTVTQYAMRAYGGRAAGTAKFDLRDPAKPAFDVQSKVDSLEADAILSAWTPAKNLLHGALSTNLQLSGSGASPADLKRTITAVGLALVADGTFGPGPTLEALARYVHVPALKTVKFKDAKVPFRVEHGAVVTDPVVLSGPYGDWRLIGSIGFDGALDYAVSATLPKEVASALGANAALAAGALSDDQGRILLDLRVRGPAAAPSVSWDTGAMRDRIAGRVSQAIAGQRSRLDSTARAFADTRTRAAADSARNVIEQAKRAAGDSLAHRVGDVFKGFFSGGRDTTKH